MNAPPCLTSRSSGLRQLATALSQGSTCPPLILALGIHGETLDLVPTKTGLKSFTVQSAMSMQLRLLTNLS